MAFVSENHPDGRFCVTAYRTEADENAESDVTSYYTTLIEAREEFERVTRGKQHYSVYLGRWLNDRDGWETLNRYPD